MLVLMLALLAPNALAGGLDGDAGVCLLRPHRVSGKRKKKSFRFEEVDRDTFERLNLSSSR
jgi:hypothetical protein